MKNRVICVLLALLMVVAMLPATAVEANAQSAMVASEEVIKCIKEYEGFRAAAYVSGGVWSIGYGTSAKPGDTVTEVEAEQALRAHLHSLEAYVNRFADQNNLRLTQNQFDALISFSYNCGVVWMNQNGRFRDAVVKGGSEADFLFAMSLWANDGTVPDPGLIKRRMAEADMYLNGVYLKRSDKYTYTIFDPNGGTPGSSGEDKMQGYRTNGQTQILVKDPSLAGYTFAGWFTQRNGGTQVTSLGSATAGRTLYAHYKSNGDTTWVSTPGETSGSDGNTVPLYSGKVTCTTYVNVRKGAGTGNAIVAKVANGTKVDIYQTEMVGTYKWGRIANGWICLEYVIADGSTGSTSGSTGETTTDKTTVTGKVSTGNLNVRSGPGTGYGKVGSLGYGSVITIFEQTTGAGTKWGRIANDRWICMDYVTLDTTAESSGSGSGSTSGSTSESGGEAARVTGAAMLNVRSGPGTDYGRMGYLNRGETITVYETQTVNGTKWGRIGQNRWVCMTYVTVDGNQSGSGDTWNAETGTGTVISKTSLNIRSGAGLGNSLVGRLSPGTTVEILEQVKSYGTWWGRTSQGWVCMDYIRMGTSGSGTSTWN